MKIEITSQKLIGVAAIVLSLGLAIAGVGYGYRQIKDGRYLNTDPTRIISVKGVSKMEVVSDKAVISFTLSGTGSTELAAAKSFDQAEKELYTKLDTKISSRLEKVNFNSYHDEGSVYVFYKTRMYQLVLTDSNEEVVDAAAEALTNAGVSDVYTRFTLKNPEEKYRELTDLAMKKAKSQAVNLTKEAKGHLGELTFVAVGYYDANSQTYSYDNAEDFFYSMPGARSEMTQTAYLTYRLR